MNAKRTRTEGDGIEAAIAHHDAEIVNLSARMSGVENSVITLGNETRAGFSQVGIQFADLKSTLQHLNSAPKVDVHRIISSVVAIAVLFSMIIGGIIYINNSQTAALVAEQKAFNSNVARTLEKSEDKLQNHETRLTKTEVELGRWSTTTREARK